MPNTTWNELYQATKLNLLRNKSFWVYVRPGPSTTHSHLEVFKIIHKITWSSGHDKSKGTCCYHWFMKDRKMIKCQGLWLKDKLITLLTRLKMKKINYCLANHKPIPSLSKTVAWLHQLACWLTYWNKS